MSTVAPTEFGRYTLLRPLGRGGMAEVYLAEVVGPGTFRKRVAVKRLLPHHAANRRFVSMMRDEAKIAAAIRHPHVAQVLDFGEVDGQHYIAMEFIDGVDLATVLRTLKAGETRLALDAALYIAACIAHGLHAAHTLEHAAIHRDVSPHNVLVSYEGAVKLIDFGVAKATNNTTKTRSGVIKGKLQYMSPEQAQAKRVDARADVFSLGMTLYKMLTARLPFTGQNEYQIYDQILRKKPVRPKALRPDLPPVVDAIVLKALRKDRARRFQTAGEMADVLDHALAQLNPEYGPHDLADMLGECVPRDEVVVSDGEDDFVSSAELVSVHSEAGDPDDESIDRLTAIHRITDAVEPARATTPAPEPDLAKTQALPVMALAVEGVDRELDRALTEAHVSDRPRPSIPPVVGPVRSTPPQPDDVVATSVVKPKPKPRPQAVPQQLVDTADMQRMTRVATDSGVVSTPSAPSVRTEHLVALRRRRVGVVAALVVAAVVLAGVLVLALRAGDNEARATAEPVHVSVHSRPDAAVLDAAIIAARAIDAAAAPPVVQPDAGGATLAAADPAKVDRAPDAAVVAPVADKDPLKPKPIRRRPTRGYLTVNALPWAHVEVDGVRLKKHTPVRKHPVRAGKHRVRLVGPNGMTWEKWVTVAPRAEVKIGHAFQ